MPAPQPKKLSLLVLALSVVTAAAHAQQDAPAAEPAEGAAQQRLPHSAARQQLERRDARAL
jgi:hypothetical protein